MLNRLAELILIQPAHPTQVVKDLAELTGMSTETIRRYKRERDCIIDARVALKMATYFEVGVAELYVDEAKKGRKENLKPGSHGKSRKPYPKAKKSV